MNLKNGQRTEEERLAEAFPSWECRALDHGSDHDGPFAVRCRKALPARPLDVTENAADETLTFTGSSWGEAFRAAESGLEPGDQGEPGTD